MYSTLTGPPTPSENSQYHRTIKRNHSLLLPWQLLSVTFQETPPVCFVLWKFTHGPLVENRIHKCFLMDRIQRQSNSYSVTLLCLAENSVKIFLVLIWIVIHSSWVDDNAFGWVHPKKFQFLFFLGKSVFRYVKRIIRLKLSQQTWCWFCLFN